MSGLNPSFPAAAWSPDGEFIAAFMDDGWAIYRTACLIDEDDCSPVHRIANVADSRVAWGPDGSVLAYLILLDNLQIQTRGCWDGSATDACFLHTVTLADGLDLREANWSQDGRYLVFSSSTGVLYLMDVTCLGTMQTCGNAVKPISSGLQLEHWPILATDASQLLYVTAPPSDIVEQIFMLDLLTDQRVQITYRDGDSILPDWSADGRYVVFAGLPSRNDGNMNIYVMDMDRRIIQGVVLNPGRDLYPAWGRTLVGDCLTVRQRCRPFHCNKVYNVSVM